MPVRQPTKARILKETLDAYSTEALGFQKRWSSSPEDVVKLQMLEKTIEWMEKRIEKCLETLPREIVPEDWNNLSNGAIVEIDEERYTFDRGHGVLRDDEGAVYRHDGGDKWKHDYARDIVGSVILIDHNV